jgi:hypothetical protein
VDVRPTGRLRENGWVRWRPVLIGLTLLLLGASLISALATSEPRRRAQSTPPPAATEPATSTDEGASRVTAILPRSKPVKANIGDVVLVTVKAPASDTAEIPALGVQGPADPGLPAQLLFTANEAGRFPVFLRDAQETVGMVEIAG